MGRPRRIFCASVALALSVLAANGASNTNDDVARAAAHPLGVRSVALPFSPRGIDRPTVQSIEKAHPRHNSSRRAPWPRPMAWEARWLARRGWTSRGANPLFAPWWIGGQWHPRASIGCCQGCRCGRPPIGLSVARHEGRPGCAAGPQSAGESAHGAQAGSHLSDTRHQARGRTAPASPVDHAHTPLIGTLLQQHLPPTQQGP